MFEFEEDIVNSLLEESPDFRRIYHKVCEIKDKVSDANHGEHPLDDYSLENLKKEKLFLKDQMAMMIKDYQSAHV